MAANFALATVLMAAAGLGALGKAVLPDQRGGRDSLDAHRGHPVVVLVVDARRFGSARRWAEDLVTELPSVHLLMVADVNEERPVTLERIARVLARRVPEQAAVLIDMQRLWATELSLDTEVPNLVVFDRAGALVARFRGRYSDELAAELRHSVPLGETAT